MLRLDPGADDGLPVVSGNVSFYNQSETGDAIAPTPIVACMGRIDDAACARNMAFKQPGSVVAFLGTFHARLGGSEYERFYGSPDPCDVPIPDFDSEVAVLRAVLQGFGQGSVLAAHDVSHGGILVTAAEMIVASHPYGVGCDLDFTPAIDRSVAPAHQLFAEFGGIVVEVAGQAWSQFEKHLSGKGVPYLRLGETRDGGSMTAETGDGRLELSLDELTAARRGDVAELLG
jgi:phosphoribosylformylglycinamidine synthase